MFKKIWNSCNRIIEILLTPLGTSLCGIIAGGIMCILAFFTTILKQFSPLSYGFIFLIGFILVIWILRGILAIWIAFSQRIATKKPTFIEYRVEEGRLNLENCSNIYKEPSSDLIENTITTVVGNRKQRRTSSTENKVEKKISIKIMALFEKPIHSSCFHCHIEKMVGKCPTKESSHVDNRWGNLIIANVDKNCSFRIWFTKQPDK